MPSPTIEEYLEAIYTMVCEDESVIGARLAERLGVSAPTVTATLHRMSRDGLVVVGENKQISLTERGEQSVQSLVRRHRLVERLLVDVLGMDWHSVHEDACRLEHAVSPAVEARLAALLGNPQTCPHGNLIPGAVAEGGDVPLCEAQPGARLVLRRVAKRAEDEPGLLRYLDEHGLRPGVSLEVLEQAPFNGPVVVHVGDQEVAVGREVAALLWLTPAK